MQILQVVKSVLLLLLFIPQNLFPQKISVRVPPHIRQIPTHIINTVFQDNQGYIWYGTEDGLCRNDGYAIQTFRSDFRNLDIPLKSNAVLSLAEDSVAHHIWIGTRKGLYVLDKQSNTISTMAAAEIKDRPVESIHIDSDGRAWLSCPQRIYQINIDGTVKQYPLQCVSGAGKEYVLYEDRDGQLLLSLSGKGLHIWDRETDKFVMLFPYTDRVNDIIQDKEHGYYWLATWDHSIIRLDPHNADEAKRYVFQKLPTTVGGLSATTALKIVQDDTYNYIWITSWSDLFVYNIAADGMLEQVDTSSFLPQRNKALRNIVKDRCGNLWVTALDDNNFFISFDEDDMHSYRMKALENRIKWTPTIVSLCKDEKDVFWVFQRRIGLCLYHAGKNELKCYTDCPAVKWQPLLVISCLLKSQQEGLVWVAGEGKHKVLGLTQDDMEIKVQREIDLSSVFRSGNPGGVTHLFEDKDRNLWIATSMGLFLYDGTKNSLKIISDNCGNISELVQTTDGLIWGIRKNKGLVCINSDGKVRAYVERNNFLSITATPDGVLWLSTDKGEVITFNSQTEEYKDYSSACGMNGDRINSIVTDSLGHVWIVTNREIREFNPQNESYRILDAANENIGFTQFLPRSVYQSSERKMYFGGIPGIFSVASSQNMEKSSMPVTPLITDVKVMGRSLYFNQERRKNSLEHVSIYPNDQNLEIHFSTLDYLHFTQIRYAYRLSGVDKEWVYLPAGINTAFYNKLGKGTYQFEVKATDENGLWSSRVSTLIIHRLPAFYETWWAYTFYAFFFLAVAFYLYLIIRNRIRLRNELHLRELEQNKLEEVNHSKLQFYTNITHELLTPLTILSAAVEELKLEVPAYKEKYKVMNNNINRLIRLLQQILEFRKAETGNLKLKVSQGDLALFVRRSVESFQPLIQKKGMRCSVSCSPDPCMAFFDPDKLDKILYNLLSNAAKYNVPDEEVSVTLVVHPEKEGFVRLSVKDNGPGISREAQKDLFKRFYEGNHRKFNTIGTGIGLSLVNDLVQLHHGTITVESEIGHGAAFIISFPSDKASYRVEEIDTDLLAEPQDSQQTADGTGEVVFSMVEEDEESVSSMERKYNLLLVEDNEELLFLMERLLSTEYKVYTATNGQEGMEIVGQNEIHLIVSDVMMPVMDGIEFCKRMKENFDTSHIPVILLTAKNQVEDRVEAYESGADGFISKPFSLSVLHARIGNLLSTHERMTKNFKKQLVFEAQELNYTSLDEDFLKKAIECVHRHLDDPEFNQQQFISELNTSRSTSFRKLKSLTGLNFPGFVNNIRMKAACRLMEEKKTIKISEVAYAVGYNDPRYFTACFKKEIGMLPMEYMEKFVLK